MKLIDELEKWIAYALLGLMVIVVISATIELAYTIVVDVFNPPGFFFGIEDLFELFGLFLMVLIGLELISSIRLFLVDHIFHVESMLLVALTAVTRKIVIIDSTVVDSAQLYGLSALIIALVGGYYLIKRSREGE